MSHPKVKDNVVMRELNDEVVLFDRESGRSVHLNTTASVIWYLCDGEHSEDDICKSVQEVFAGAEPERVRSEVAETVAKLRSENLLE